jgi:hypothetical protein
MIKEKPMDFNKGDEVILNMPVDHEPGWISGFDIVEGVSPAGVTLRNHGLVSPTWLVLNRSADDRCDFIPSKVKDSNPKDAIGIKKAPMSTVPSAVVMEIGLAMLEGALKYGRHNYRAIGVRASVYYDACMRHLMSWWEGEDIDPDSGLSHITKALACLTVLRDAMWNNKWVDDRPPSMDDGWVTQLSSRAKDLIEKCPEPKAAYTKESKDADKNT